MSGPSGYSFNLDGTAIYLTMASLFIGEAMDKPFSIDRDQAAAVLRGDLPFDEARMIDVEPAEEGAGTPTGAASAAATAGAAATASA